MKKSHFILILLLFCFTSCTDYDYYWKTEIIYTNGDSEILYISRRSFNSLECNLYLYTHRGNSTLISRCGNKDKVEANEVRRFRILKLNKLKVIN